MYQTLFNLLLEKGEIEAPRKSTGVLAGMVA
jgi:hypothetical protein